mgnify:FL=1
MTETTIRDDEATILVEFEPQPGVRQVSRFGDLTKDQIEKLAERSEYALDRAMETVRAMAHRVTETVREIKLSERPDEVAVEFGLKLDAEAGAYIAKAGGEAGFKVMLKWEREKE